MRGEPISERWNEMLLEIYGASDLAQFRERALAGTRRLFDGEMVCHNELNMVDGSSLSALSRPVEVFEAIRPAFFDHVQEHPSIQHHLAANGSETRAIKTSDFVSQRRWRGSGLYREFYQPLSDIRYQLTIGQRIDDSLVFFAISRRNCDFTEEERAVLTALRPHFIQAYRNARSREELETIRRQAVAPGGNGSSAGTNGDHGTLDTGAVEFVLMRRFGLSKAEARVLRALSAGRTNAAICDELHISLPTVKTHLDKIYRRLAVANRVEAALAAARALTETSPL